MAAPTFALTTLSSKGQIVLPKSFRKSLHKGDKVLLIGDGERIILKRADRLMKQLVEDIEFARRTEAAWKRYERGEFKSMPYDDFLRELEKW